MKKYAIPLALILAFILITPIAAAVNIFNINYEAVGADANVTISSGTITIDIDTNQSVLTVGDYPTFAELETALEDLDITVSWLNNEAERKKATLSTTTITDQSKTVLKDTEVTITAGGTYDDSTSPYIGISGSIDGVLFVLQLYQPTNWRIIYESSGTLYLIAGP